MLKVLAACGCGMGSSQLLKKNCSTVLKNLGIEHTVHHTSIDEAKSTAHDYDLIVVGENLLLFTRHYSARCFRTFLCGNPEFFSAKSHLFAISVHREACYWSRSEQ